MIAADASARLVTPVRWRAWEVVLWVAIWIAPFALPQYAALINEIAIFALFAVSLDIVLGYAGIVSLGHAAFFGAGGYALFQTPSGALADRLGARRILTVVVASWSLFTGLTAATWNFTSLLVIRFFFGAGEAGAFPGMARVVYSWIPVRERGLVKGINFSGSRLGAAVTMPIRQVFSFFSSDFSLLRLNF